MENKKLNIIFDANILASGASKGCSRSGIYFATMNILKEPANNENTEIKLYCDYKNYAKVSLALMNDFSNFDFQL